MYSLFSRDDLAATLLYRVLFIYFFIYINSRRSCTKINKIAREIFLFIRGRTMKIIYVGKINYRDTLYLSMLSVSCLALPYKGDAMSFACSFAR